MVQVEASFGSLAWAGMYYPKPRVENTAIVIHAQIVGAQVRAVAVQLCCCLCSGPTACMACIVQVGSVANCYLILKAEAAQPSLLCPRAWFAKLLQVVVYTKDQPGSIWDMQWTGDDGTASFFLVPK
jgi:hypothetical protein